MAKMMKVHPLCLKFRKLAPMTPAQIKALRDDISENGIKVPILVNRARDTILDGLSRYNIARNLKLTIPEKDYEVFLGKDDEIAAEILSRNLFRRHINDDMRVSIVRELRGAEHDKAAAERSKAGVPSKDGGGNGKSVTQLAKEAGVSKHKAALAIKADKGGKLKEVTGGRMKLREAAKSVGTKKRKPAKPVSWEDEVFKK